MSEWAVVETWGGDKSYESPALTFGGAATIYVHPEDCEGCALTLRVAVDLREGASLPLTFSEARELSEWLARAATEMEKEAVEAPS